MWIVHRLRHKFSFSSFFSRILLTHILIFVRTQTHYLQVIFSYSHILIFSYSHSYTDTGCLAYKSLALRNPPVNLVDATAAKTEDAMPYYVRIAQGKANAFFSIFLLFKYPQYEDAQQNNAQSEIRDIIVTKI